MDKWCSTPGGVLGGCTGEIRRLWWGLWGCSTPGGVLGGLHAASAVDAKPANQCSTPGGVLGGCTCGKNGSEAASRVLNAWRRLRGLHDHRPEGRGEEQRVLNAWRRLRGLHGRPAMSHPSPTRCSTPGGVLGGCTPRPAASAGGATTVLNAWRRLRGLHGAEVKPDARLPAVLNAWRRLRGLHMSVFYLEVEAV